MHATPSRVIVDVPVSKRRRVPRQFGTVRPLPSGRYQASYLPPSGIRINAPETLLTRQDADGWLARQRTALESGRWHDPGAGRELFGQYAERWIAERELKPRTRAHYRRILDRFLLPKFGAVELRAITPRQVRSWHAALDPQTPTMNTHAYSLLRGIFTTAVADDAVPANPCRVRGAGQTKRKIDPRPATLTELEVITAEMPERLQLMVLLAAWCALRFGELTELRRSDVLLGDGRTGDARRGAGRRRARRRFPEVAGRNADGLDPAAPAARRRGSSCRVRRRTSRRVAVSRASAAICRPRRSMTRSIRPATRPGVPTCASTTCGTPARCWPLRRGPRWPS